jgi:GNAT superfamily N-acetyltransferase
VHLEVLGWPDDDVTLRLDYRRFAYAGKFVMSSTGKAVAHERERPVRDTNDDPASAFADRDSDEYATDVVAAVAFNEDRTDSGTLWLRYVTVRDDHRGEGVGPRLLAVVRDAALDRGYDRLRIAVNNAYSYEALYKTGFAYTGCETGIAELVLEHPAPVDVADDPETTGAPDAATVRYRDGLDVFADREDLSDEERAFVAAKRDRGPPAPDT